MSCKKVADTFNEDASLDAVYGDVHFVNPEDLERCVRYYSSRVFNRKLMKLGFMPAHPSFYVRKECFEKYGIYKTDYKIAADFEFLLRVIYKNKIKTKYIPFDMVTMRTGGASTSGLESHKRIMKEHLRAFHENDIYTNVFLLSLRYIYKTGEVIKQKYLQTKKKRMKHIIILTILCSFLSINKIHAQFTTGVTGLLHMPSAEMQKDGTAVIGGNFLNKHNLPSDYWWGYNTYNYFVNITFFSRVEIAYVMTLVKGQKHISY